MFKRIVIFVMLKVVELAVLIAGLLYFEIALVIFAAVGLYWLIVLNWELAGRITKRRIK